MELPRLRFRLDEHLTHAIAHALRRQGVDIVTAAETETVGLPDDRLLALCLAEGRVLVTNDKDHLRLHEEGTPHAGIVFSAHRARSTGEMVAFLLLAAYVIPPEEIANNVEFA